MSNDGLVLTPSLDTVSEVICAVLLPPPMMTRLRSWPTVQTLEPLFSFMRMSGRFSQAPCAALHWVQLLSVTVLSPPQTMLPD